MLCCVVLCCVVLCCVVLYCIVLTVCFVCLFIQDEISRAYLKILQASGKAKEFLASIVMAEVSTLGKPYRVMWLSAIHTFLIKLCSL